MSLIEDYIISLVNLQGIIQKDMVVKIYNQQNEDKIKNINLTEMKADDKNLDEEYLQKKEIEVVDDYFVHYVVNDLEIFKELKERKTENPYYIPEKEILLKYRDIDYSEEYEEYDDLKNYIKENYLDDEEKIKDILLMLRNLVKIYKKNDALVENFIDELNIKNISKKSIETLSEKLLEFALNTKSWWRNGYSTEELINILRASNDRLKKSYEMNEVEKYLIAAVNLYGTIHKNKFIEIYNHYHEKKIMNFDTEYLLADEIPISKEILKKHFIEQYEDYFVNDALINFEDMIEYLKMKENKPYYIPNKNEFIKYLDDEYFEKDKHYHELLKFVEKEIVDGDKEYAEEILDDIQIGCSMSNKLSSIMNEFQRRGIIFDSEDQIRKLSDLVIKFYNNTRMWENNGHTPNEIRRLSNLNKPKKKIGRNDPCPCGSGKKYKKCCMNKENS
jgi:hypothetical protein